MAVEPYRNPYSEKIESRALHNDDELADKGLFENNDMVKLVETYLDENVPKDVRKSDIYQKMWAIVGKKLQLTFLDKEDMYDFEASFIQSKLLYLMSMRREDKTFDVLQTFKQIEFYFKAALRSAIGTKENRFNERLTQASTIRHNISSNSETFGAQKPRTGGFLSKLF